MSMLDKLNDEQLEAATCNDRTTLCLAAAGCGKTSTMTARIERLVNEGVDPSSILALTFTNAAAFEMKERYKKLPGIRLDIVPEFRTFHGFCYSLIVRDLEVRERLGYTKIPSLCDDTMLKELRAKVKLQIGCTLSDAMLDNDIALSKKDEEMKALFNKALIKQIKKENVITFDMMCYNVCEMFVKNEPCTIKYKNKYRYLFVDEMQDSDARQYRFIGSFPETTNFFLVGDCLQNLYSFRGCSNEYIKQLVHAPGWRVIKMCKNYRSTKKICDYANNFSRYSKDDFRVVMESQRGEGEPVEQIFGSNAGYGEAVDEHHLEILARKIKNNNRESAVLCRTNKEVAAVKEYLKEEGIDYVSNSKPKDTLEYLEAALSNDYMLEWLSSMLEARDYGDYIRTSAIESNPDIKWFLANYSRIDKIRIAANKVTDIRKICSDNFMHPQDKFEKITKLLRIKSKCKFEGDERTTAKEVIEMIKSQVEEQQECRLYIGTIHSAKGLEYDTVYVMGVNEYTFQLGSEEMNNLFYVAVTRAKDHLIIFRK